MSVIEDRADAAAMIAEAGQAVVLTYVAPGAYDPATSSVVATETTATTKGVVLPMPRLTMIGFGDARGTDIIAGDQMLLLSAIDSNGAPIAQPKANDRAAINGDDYSLVTVSPLAPAGTTIFFECFIRGVSQ